MSKTSIFLLGATGKLGYIGGSVLARLLAHPNASSYEITVLVRSPEKAKKLESFGVKPVVGTLKDHALLEKVSEHAHVVFSMARSDDIGAIEAILRGLKNRHAKYGNTPSLIHTSGLRVLTFGDASTKGLAVSDTIFDDSDLDQLASIPPDALHRPLELSIIQADIDGYVKTAIILPGIVYGIAQTPLVDAGIQNAQAAGITRLSSVALDRGRAGMVGKGLPIWPIVSVDDNKVGHGVGGYYFGENGELSWYDIAKAIGKAMLKHGVGDTDEPSSFTSDELVKYLGNETTINVFGANSRAHATRSRSIGWNPKKSVQDMLASIEVQFEVELKAWKK